MLYDLYLLTCHHIAKIPTTEDIILLIWEIAINFEAFLKFNFIVKTCHFRKVFALNA